MLHPRLRVGATAADDDLEAQQAAFLASKEAPAARASRTVGRLAPAKTASKSVSFAANTKPPQPTRPSLLGEIVEHSALNRPSAPAALDSLSADVVRVGFPLVPEVMVSSSPTPADKRRKPSLFAQFLKAQQPQSAPPVHQPPPDSPMNQHVDVASNGNNNNIDSEADATRSGIGGRSKDRETLRSIARENDSRVAAMSAEDVARAAEELTARFGTELLTGLLKWSERRDAHHAQSTKANVEVEAPKPAPHTTTKTTTATTTTSTAMTKSPSSTRKTGKRAHKRHVQDLSWIKSSEDLWAAARDLPDSEREKLRWVRPDLFRDDEDAGDGDGGSSINNKQQNTSEDQRTQRTPRFDLYGQTMASDIQSSDKSTTITNSALYHHGDEPDRAGYSMDELMTLMRSSVAGQRLVALRALEGLLRRRRAALWNTRTPHAQRVIPDKLALLLRCALDDPVGAVQSAAAAALAEFLVHVEHQQQRVELAQLHGCRCPWAPAARAQGSAHGFIRDADFGWDGEGNADGADAAHDEEPPTDDDRLAASPVRGMVHTGLLVRMSFVLGCEGQAASASGMTKEAKARCMEVLVHMAQHSEWAVNELMTHPRLLRGIVKQFLEVDLLLPSKTEASPNGTAERSKNGLASDLSLSNLALRLMNAIASRHRRFAHELVRGAVCNASKRFLGFACRIESNLRSPPLQAVVNGVLILWRTVLCYGLDTADVLGFLPLFQNVAKEFPESRSCINLLLVAFMHFCVDDLRREQVETPRNEDIDAGSEFDSVSTEVGERLAHVLDALGSDEQRALDAGWVVSASVLRVSEAFARLLMGVTLVDTAWLENRLCAEASFETETAHAAVDLATAAVQCKSNQLMESIKHYVTKLVRVFIRAGTRRTSVAVALLATSSGGSMDVCVMLEWLLALSTGLDMCLDAGARFGVQIAGQSVVHALRQSTLLSVELPQLLQRLVGADGEVGYTGNAKVALEPAQAHAARLRALLICSLASVLVRVRGCVGMNADVQAEARARRCLIIRVVQQIALYEGDEWFARSAVGGLLSPAVSGGLGNESGASKHVLELITCTGRPALLRMFTGVLGGPDAIVRSCDLHHGRVLKVASCVIGQPSASATAFSEAGGAWPALALRMAFGDGRNESVVGSSSGGDSPASRQTEELVWLSLNVADAIGSDLSSAHLVLLILRLLTNAPATWLSETAIQSVVLRVLRRALVSSESSSEECNDDDGNDGKRHHFLLSRLRAAAGGRRALTALASRLVQAYCNASFGNQASAAGVMVLLRRGMADGDMYEQTLCELGEGELLASLGDEPPEDDALLCTREQVNEAIARAWVGALARRSLTRERGALAYWVAVHHVAVVRGSWLGDLLRKELASVPQALADVDWYVGMGRLPSRTEVAKHQSCTAAVSS